MADGVRSIVNWVAENASAPGIVPLMAFTPVAANLSLTQAPSGSTGMHLYVKVISNTVVGSLVITGKDINGNALVVTLPASGSIPIPPADAQNPYVGAFEWVTPEVFGSGTILSNALAITGLTNGSVSVGGIQAGKYELPIDFDFDLQFEDESPDEMRGSYVRDFILMQLRRIAMVEKADQDLYPETSLWLFLMLVNASPTVTTLPSTPTVLKTSAAISGGPFSLTTQPLAPGQKLQFVTSGVGAAGTIVITGTDVNGLAQTETIVVPNVASGTYYSAFRYKTVGATSVSFTGLTGGSVAINGVYGFKWVFAFTGVQGSPLTGCFEFFTGTDSGILPYVALEEGNIEFTLDKIVKLTGIKGIAQDWLPFGDRTTQNMGSSRVVALGQPTDRPFTGTWSQTWVDPASTNAPQTTLYADLISSKIGIKWPVAGKWTSILSAIFNRVRRKKAEVTIDATIEFTELSQAEAYRKSQRQYLSYQFIGQDMGGGNPKSFTLTAAAKIRKFKRKVGIDVDSVEADVSYTPLYDPGLGALFTITVVNEQPPTYTA